MTETVETAETVVETTPPAKPGAIRWKRTRSPEGFYTKPPEWTSQFCGMSLRLERQPGMRYMYEVHKDEQQVLTGIAEECDVHWDAGDVLRRHMEGENLI